MKSETNQPFRSEWVSEAVLRRLMQHGLVVRMIRVRNKDQARSDPNTLLYQQGKAYDYFVLILEGRVEVKNETNSQTDQRGFPVEILRVLRLTVGRFFLFFFVAFVQVVVGRENLLFESGPFTHFGSQALAVLNLPSTAIANLGMLPNLVLNPVSPQ